MPTPTQSQFSSYGPVQFRNGQLMQQYTQGTGLNPRYDQNKIGYGSGLPQWREVPGWQDRMKQMEGPAAAPAEAAPVQAPTSMFQREMATQDYGASPAQKAVTPGAAPQTANQPVDNMSKLLQMLFGITLGG